MLRIPALLVLVAIPLAWFGWSAKISLSVAGGGVIGLANLWLWRRLIAGLLARYAGENAGSGAALAVQALLKIGLLLLLFVVALRVRLDLLGVLIGYGLTLVGLMFAKREA